MFRKIFASIAAFSCVCVFPGTAVASWECRKPVAQNEVRVFEHQDLVGDCQSYFLKPGLRHRLVQQLDQRWQKRISSIWVGGSVSVMFFEQPGFRGLFSYRKTDSPQARNLKLDDATSMFGNWDERIASLIVFRRGTVAQGVFLDPVGPPGQNNSQFFPLPEPARQLTAAFPILPAHLRNRVGAVNVMGGPELVAELFESPHFKGRSIVLPPPGTKKDYSSKPLKPYGFHARPASLKVIQTAVRIKPVPLQEIKPGPGIKSIFPKADIRR